MIDLAAATLVEFPLRGEWCAASTPAEQVPSHGTDYFGQRYAFDFFRVNPSTQTPYAGTFTKHLFGLVKVQDCFAWDQPSISVF